MHPLPVQPAAVPWPTQAWPEAPPPADVDAAALESAAEALMDVEERERFGKTLALLVVQRGCIVLERYGPGVEPTATQRSWSMAKSVLHALVGNLVADGLVDLHGPAPVPKWGGDGDPRRAITVEHLLRMVDGLDFVEHYEAGGRSDVIEMLRDARRADTAAYAEAKGLAHPPGSVFNYSSGTSMIVSAIAKRALAGRSTNDAHAARETDGVIDARDAMLAYMRERLFEPLGMWSALPRFDGAGTFIGSSYLFATARDFAKFGLLYLRDGVWEDRRLLPSGWADHGRQLTLPSADEYGAHWWLNVAEPGTFCAKGFQGQYVLLSPQRDVVVVRLGVSTEPQRVGVVEGLGEILACFPTVTKEMTE